METRQKVKKMINEIRSWIGKNLVAILLTILIIIVAVTIIAVVVSNENQNRVVEPLVENDFELVYNTTMIEIGESINLTIETDLYLEWSLNDDSMGYLEKISNNEVVFTASKKGNVVVSVIAPKSNKRAEVAIEIFYPPTLNVTLPNFGLLTVNEDQKISINFPKDSVTVNKVTIENNGDIVEEFNGSLDSIYPNLEKIGIYNLTVEGTTFRGDSIEYVTRFSGVIAKEIFMGQSEMVLQDMNTYNLETFEILLENSQGIYLNVAEVLKNGTIIKANRAYVAILYSKGLYHPNALIRSGMSGEGFSSLLTDQEVKIKNVFNKGNEKWTIGVIYTKYTDSIAAMFAFPKDDPSYYLDYVGETTSLINTGDTSSGGGSGGSIVPPPPVVIPPPSIAVGPSPDIRP